MPDPTPRSLELLARKIDCPHDLWISTLVGSSVTTVVCRDCAILAIDAALTEQAAGHRQDDPMMDATDGAHPAWWRGHDHTARVFCQIVTKILDGQDDGHGFNVEPWGTVRQRLLALTEQAAELGRVVEWKDAAIRDVLDSQGGRPDEHSDIRELHDWFARLERSWGQLGDALALTPATVRARTEKERRVVEALRDALELALTSEDPNQWEGAAHQALDDLAAPPEGA